MSFIIGKKGVMTQIWKDEKVIPVTVIHAAPNKATMVRTKERDGYEAVQLKAVNGSREFRKKTGRDFTELKVGDEFGVDTFKEGDLVIVSGTMKGRGFQGVVKRHGFHGGPKTHGQKNRHRAPGSLGATAPQRVVPGRKMAGRMGGTRSTVKNLVVAQIDKENNLIMLRGAVPGNRGGLIEISKLVK
jgi:large subunit ribosomal protein L3